MQRQIFSRPPHPPTRTLGEERASTRLAQRHGPLADWRGNCGRLPSSAFLSHSTNCFICSRKTLFPLARWLSLYHFRIASSLKTSAKGRQENVERKVSRHYVALAISNLRSTNQTIHHEAQLCNTNKFHSISLVIV